jgi:hypothetical protein
VNHRVKLTTADRVEITDLDDNLIVKVYLSPDGRKLRFVLPEFKTLAQPKLDDCNHLIDFTRDVHTAREEIALAQRKARGYE